MDSTISTTQDETIALTKLINLSQDGHDKALKEVYEFVYSKLKSIARRTNRGRRKDATLDTSGIVHDFFLKFSRANKMEIQSRQHFFNLSGRIMRQIVINEARERMAQKRGGTDAISVELSENMVVDIASPADLLLANEALEKLDSDHPAAANVFTHKRYLGLTNNEIAETLGISVSTVKRYLAYANAFLLRHLELGKKKKPEDDQ